MAKDKQSRKHPQSKHKKNKKSQHDKRKRLQRPNPNRKKTSNAKVPLTGAMQTVVSVLQAVMDRRIAFRLAIIVSGMLLADDRRTASAWFVSAGVQDDWDRFYGCLASVGQTSGKMATAVLGLVVELPEGTLMMNMRNYWGRDGKQRDKDKMRAVALSQDGGETWGKLRFDESLIEPICQGSLLRYSAKGDASDGRLLFSNPASKTKRERLTVRLSHDQGKTWPAALMLHEGPSAYSCLTVLPDGSIGCFYEGGEKECLLTGTPGCGKTPFVHRVVQQYDDVRLAIPKNFGETPPAHTTQVALGVNSQQCLFRGYTSAS